ncbi:hypothetical protein AVEN_46867-1 [Araneus ventricosus]|uniref:Secreted protein n=1 Tax=Araneus ventricosus TaxID=182803 RepID=A0A4Y2CPS9_ARAVE|nr:hypothetical protein AVEN_46867-1 [Araneus ventricosus]
MPSLRKAVLLYALATGLAETGDDDRENVIKKKRYPVPIARGFVRWVQHSGETSVNDRKVKGSGLDRDLSTVPTGSCNCVCVGIRQSSVRCNILEKHL